MSAIEDIDRKRFTLLIPKYLKKHPDSVTYNIYTSLRKNNKVITNALEVLKEHGIVSEKNVPNSNARIFNLTKRGHKFAEKINEIEKILNEK